jgi:putative Mg2+ transporter-C (MgtC) family protein
MNFYLEISLRLLLAGILGGIIGFEREHTNRPAGFRTHILVCLGSALVMVTSEFIFDKYHLLSNMDPTRLGAQVISGIGFLGAGTIIRDGINVRGLTTAASLWAVSCVGIAVGIGFYEGAIIATVLIFLTLIALKKTETLLIRKNKFKVIIIESDNVAGQIGFITSAFEKNSVNIKNIEFVNDQEDKLMVKLLVKAPEGMNDKQVINELHDIKGIRRVYEE